MVSMEGRRAGSEGSISGHPVVACFISPHGLGHAARASAVLCALHRKVPSCRFHIYTTVPRWFFTDSMAGPFELDPMETDIGLVQKTPLVEDLTATADRLDAWYPLADSLVSRLAQTLARRQTCLVICDIAPLGIAAAQKAGIPSVLLENFTWDWIYEGYGDCQERFSRHIDYLKGLFAQAGIRIRARPVCGDVQGHLTVPPISRLPRQSRELARKGLGVGPDETLVLVSLGGTPLKEGMLGLGPIPDKIRIVVPGDGGALSGSHPRCRVVGPHDCYHPDLIGACDAVIGKTGYSTLAEVFHAGIPFGYVSRGGFRESAVLEAFARDVMGGVALTQEELKTGAWIEKVPALAALRREPSRPANGAEAAAGYIVSLIQCLSINRQPNF